MDKKRLLQQTMCLLGNWYTLLRLERKMFRRCTEGMRLLPYQNNNLLSIWYNQERRRQNMFLLGI